MLNCLLEFAQPHRTNGRLLVFRIANGAFDPFNTQLCHFFSHRRLSTTCRPATTAISTLTALSAATTAVSFTRPSTPTPSGGPALTRFLFTGRSCLSRLFSSTGSGNGKPLSLLLTDNF